MTFNRKAEEKMLIVRALQVVLILIRRTKERETRKVKVYSRDHLSKNPMVFSNSKLLTVHYHLKDRKDSPLHHLDDSEGVVIGVPLRIVRVLI